MNTTVAPNVSLSRTNLPSDAQLSPNFAQTLMQQQLSPGLSTPYSPQPNQGLNPLSSHEHLIPNRLRFLAGYAPQFPQPGQRLSPQQQQQLNQQQQQQQQNNAQQQQMAYQQQQQQQQQVGDGGRSNTPFGSNSGMQSPGMQNSPQQWGGGGGGGGGGGPGGPLPAGNAGRTLQQHNPMLIAQLQVSDA